MFRENWCESLWRVASVRILFIVFVFDDFCDRHSSFILYWFCICFVKMHVTVVGGCRMLVVGLFCRVFCFYDFGVLEGPTGSIFWILYWFYKCFVQIDVRVCGGVQVFAFCLFYDQWFRWRSQFIDSILVLYMFCGNAFDRCWRMSNVRFWFVLQCSFMISGSWKGQTEAYSVFYIGFIHVSRKLMWEFVDGFQCSKICVFMLCFWWFRIVLILYWFCICFVAGSGRWPGGHRAGTGPGPVLSDIHRPPFNTLSKNPISRA